MRVLVSPDVYAGLPTTKQAMVRSGRRESDPQIIIDAVCECLGIEYKDLQSPSRKRELSEARSIAIGLILQVTPFYGLQRLGNLLGGRDHSTILYNNNTFKDLYEVDKSYTLKVNTVLKFV